MRGRALTEADREHYYRRFEALSQVGMEPPAIAKRLGLPYSTLRYIIGRNGENNKEVLPVAQKKKPEEAKEKEDVIIEKIIEHSSKLLHSNKGDLKKALKNRDGALSISINANISGDEPVEIKATLSFVVDTVKDSTEKEEIYLKQLNLPEPEKAAA